MIGFGDYTKGDYTKKVEISTITSLTDKRLVKIDPQEEGFFDAVLNFKPTNKGINDFIEAVAEVKEARIEAFYRAIYDPVEVGDHMVTFNKGMPPAIGNSAKWWVKTAKNMPHVEGKQWHLATDYQYYAFLVWLINQLVKEGKCVKKALNWVVIDSRKLENYHNSKKTPKEDPPELTGSRCICGICDLSNTFKILEVSNRKARGFWKAGGYCEYSWSTYSLANLTYIDKDDHWPFLCVGLLVL